MFRIDSTQAIYMNSGDDIDFPVFLNKGNQYSPIRYEFSSDDECEMYFYILNRNSCENNYILKKIFKTNGTIETYFSDGKMETSSDNYVINDNKDIVIHLRSVDTAKICCGKYEYLIKAKIKSLENTSEYVLNTVTNRKPFVITGNNTPIEYR